MFVPPFFGGCKDSDYFTINKVINSLFYICLTFARNSRTRFVYSSGYLA